MRLLSRLLDKNAKGGAIIRGSMTVLANGRPVGLSPSPITCHGHNEHASAMTVVGSLTVLVEGSPIIAFGDICTCGDPIIEGSTDIFCP